MCHPHTDCFIISQLFSVARHIRRLKLGSKPAQLYVRLSIIPLRQQANHISSRIIRHVFALLDTRVLNSFKELCIMRVAAINSFARVLNPCGGHTHTFNLSMTIDLGRKIESEERWTPPKCSYPRHTTRIAFPQANQITGPVNKRDVHRVWVLLIHLLFWNLFRY